VQMKKSFTSMRCAYNGIHHAFLTERNMRIHFFAFALALIAAALLEISKIEFLIILGISAVTFSLELTNTAIERLADKVAPEYDEKIGVVKDVMAGAVFVSSIFSVIIGLVIFAGPVMKLIQR
jgi:diacylglycerol kinase